MRNALCVSEPGIGLAIQMIVLCLIALSAWLVLRVGRVSLGQQAYFGLGAYCAAMLTSIWQWPIALALLAATAFGAAAAALVASALLRLPGLYFAVATLAVAELVRLGLSGFRYQVVGADGTRIGPDGINGFRDIRWLFANDVSQTEYLVWCSLVLVVIVLMLVLLTRTRLGVAMHAVGHDELLADSQGLPVARIRLLAVTLAGGVAAFAGGVYAHQFSYIEPAIFDPMLGIHAVAYSMLDGLATPLGPLLGAAFDLGLLEGMRIFEGWRMVVFGTLVAVFLKWRPRGLLDETALQRMANGWRTFQSQRASKAHQSKAA